MAFHDALQEVLSVGIIRRIPLRALLQASVKVQPIEVDGHGSRGSSGRLRRSDDRAVEGLRVHAFFERRPADLQRVQGIEVDRVLPFGRSACLIFHRGASLHIVEWPAAALGVLGMSGLGPR